MVTSDAAVIGRVLAGEADAFGLLVERYQERCIRLATRLLGDADDAADAVQDAFLRAYLSLDRYQERDRFSSWLLCIVVNRCRTTAERAVRRAHLANEWWHTHGAGEPVATNHPSGDHALSQCLERALSALPPVTRMAVIRKYADELSYEEISADTGMAVSALKMRVARGSAQLRQVLAGAGITAAAAVILCVGHRPHQRETRAPAVVACDTLGALMRDTLGQAVRDSMLPPGRCEPDSLNTAVQKPSAAPGTFLNRPGL